MVRRQVQFLGQVDIPARSFGGAVGRAVGRQEVVVVVREELGGHAPLAQVVDALRPFARSLDLHHHRHQQAHHDPDDADDDQ